MRDTTTYARDWRHRTGRQKPMSENRACSAFLGVHVAERLLPGLFDHVERAPYGNPGWDFKCGKSKLIDVKSACLRQHKERPSLYWLFHVRRNTTADYFLFLGFNNNRDALEPMRMWLIPGYLINSNVTITISNVQEALEKWIEYEKPLDKVIVCCKQMRTKV
jgi:hypothetical protein